MSLKIKPHLPTINISKSPQNSVSHFINNNKKLSSATKMDNFQAFTSQKTEPNFYKMKDDSNSRIKTNVIQFNFNN